MKKLFFTFALISTGVSFANEKIKIFTAEAVQFGTNTNIVPYAAGGEFFGVIKAIIDNRKAKQLIPFDLPIRNSLLSACLKNYFLGGIFGTCVGINIEKESIKREMPIFLNRLKSKGII
jgi:hypothetical protein